MSIDWMQFMAGCQSVVCVRVLCACVSNGSVDVLLLSLLLLLYRRGECRWLQQ